MYLPKIFAEHDIATLHALMRANPLATLVTQGTEGLEANHIPLFLQVGETTGTSETSGTYGVLQGHVARANPLWKPGSVNGEVLVIFKGVDGYISPSGQASKAEHGKVVPTWNYAVAHAYGELTIRDDPDWVYRQVSTLTNTHEAAMPAPWAVSDAPEEYIRKMLGAIVGIEIPITRLYGKWKACQDEPLADRKSLVAAQEKNHPPMAELIQSCLQKSTGSIS